MSDVLIFLQSKEGQTRGILSNEIPDACPFYRDRFTEVKETGWITLELEIPADHSTAEFLELDTRIIYPDHLGRRRILTIKDVDDTAESGIRKSIYAEGSHEELLDDIVRPFYYVNATPAALLTKVLEGSAWNVGRIESDLPLEMDVQDFPLKAEGVHQVAQASGTFPLFRIEYSQERGREEKFVDLLLRRGRDTGKMLDYEKDILSLTRKRHVRELYTAVLPLGKSNENNERLTIKDVVFSKAAGDLFDKENGKDIIIDPEATGLWGRVGGGPKVGKYENSEQTDPNLLAIEAWEWLQEYTRPAYEYTAKGVDLYILTGEEHEIFDIGDTITIRNLDMNPPLLIEAEIDQTKRSHTEPETDEFEFGNFNDIYGRESDILNMLLNKVNRKSGSWDVTGRTWWEGSSAPDPSEYDTWLKNDVVPHVWFSWSGVEWLRATAVLPGDVGTIGTSDIDIRDDQAEGAAINFAIDRTPKVYSQPTAPGGEISIGSFWLNEVEKVWYKWNGTLWISQSLTDLSELSGIVIREQIGIGAVAEAQLDALAVTLGKIAPLSIDTTKIVNDAITNAKIGPSAVGTTEIIDRAMATNKIALDAITNDLMALNSIGTNEVMARALTGAKIAIDTITNDLMGPGSISTLEIVDRALITNKIALDAITADLMAINSVGTSEIVGRAMTGVKIALDTITNDLMGPGSIGSLEILDSAISSAKISLDAITNDLIAPGAVGIVEIVNNSISTAKIQLDAITNDLMAINSVGSAEIVNLAISTAKIQADAITADLMGINSVGTSEIIARSLTNAKIALDAIDNTLLADGSVNVEQLIARAVTGAKMALTTIANENVIDRTIVAGKMVAGTITANEIAGLTITAAKMVAGTLTATQIAVRTITADRIVTNAITANEIAALTITAGQIAANAITADKIIAGAITTNHIATIGLDAQVIKTGFLDAGRVRIGAATAFDPQFDTISNNKYSSVQIPSGGGGKWFRIASNSGNRAHGKFILRDITSSQHATASFEVDTNYGKVSDVILHSYSVYSSVSFSKIRVLRLSTYDPVYIEVFVEDQARIQSLDMWITENIQVAGWVAEPWTDGAIPLNYVVDNQKNITVADTVNGVSNAAAGQVNLWSYLDTTYIDGGSIYTNTITANEIAALTITAAQIAATTITANKIVVGSLTSNEIASRSIVAGDIVADSLTAGEIASNAITVNELASNSVTAIKIVGVSITADKLVTNSITAAQIAALTITAAQIASKTIAAGQIAADAITATELASNSVVAASVVANTLTAGQIATNAITADELAANSVVAVNIAANVITGDKLVINSITAREIAALTITAAQIATNAITADKIIAGAITTNHVTTAGLDALVIKTGVLDAGRVRIGGSSTFEDGFHPKVASAGSTANRIFSNLAGINGQNAESTTAIIRTPMTFGNFMTRVDLTGYVYTGGSETIDVSIGFYAYATNGGSYTNTGYTTKGKTAVKSVQLAKDANSKVVIIVNFEGTSLSYPKLLVEKVQISHAGAPDSYVDGWSIALSADLTGLTVMNTPPGQDYDLTHNQTMLWTYLDTTYIDGGNIYTNTITANSIAVGAITANELATNSVTAIKILARAITADKIVLNSLTANEIAAGAITASEIVAKTITAGQIAADAITATELAANSVVAASIVARTITADRMVLNSITSAEILANTITAADIAALTISAGLLVANTLTAAQIATNSITADELAANSVVAVNIAANVITGDKLVINTITAREIAAAQITTNHIATIGLDAAVIKFGLMSGDRIIANSINADRLKAGTVIANDISFSGKFTSAADTTRALQITGSGDVKSITPEYPNGRTLFGIEDTLPAMYDGNMANASVIPESFGKMYTHNFKITVPAASYTTNSFIAYTLNISDYTSVGIAGVKTVQLSAISKEWRSYEQDNGRVFLGGDLKSMVIRISPNFAYTSGGTTIDVSILIIGTR